MPTCQSPPQPNWLILGLALPHLVLGPCRTPGGWGSPLGWAKGIDRKHHPSAPPVLPSKACGREGKSVSNVHLAEGGCPRPSSALNPLWGGHRNQVDPALLGVTWGRVSDVSCPAQGGFGRPGDYSRGTETPGARTRRTLGKGCSGRGRGCEASAGGAGSWVATAGPHYKVSPAESCHRLLSAGTNPPPAAGR